jgi:DNA-binding HxlR family transcriptional regulator
MTKLVEAEVRILEALREARPNEYGLTNKELQKIPGLFPSNLSKFLKRLQASGLVQRDPETRRYRATPSGKSVSNATEMDIITRDNQNKKLTLKLKSNADDIYWIGIFPVEATIYLSPEIESLIRDVKSHKADVYQAKDTVFRYAVRPVETHFERLFFLRLSTFIENYIKDLRQQNNGTNLWSSSISQNATFTKLIPTLRKQHNAIDSSKYGLSRLLDFNAAILVKVWKEGIAANLEDVKDRIVVHVLVDVKQALDEAAHLRRVKDQASRNVLVMTVIVWLGAITKMGLLSAEEFDRVCQAKSVKGINTVVTMLATNYYAKVYHGRPNMETLRKIQQPTGELERILNQAR